MGHVCVINKAVLGALCGSQAYTSSQRIANSLLWRAAQLDMVNK